MQKIKNIIFDYGNVIFEINFQKVQNALSQLGIPNIDTFFGHKGQNSIFSQLESGASSPAQFRDEIRKAASNDALTDQEIDNAWNSILIGVPPNVHEVLAAVKQHYRTFLLSNTNEIHYNYILKYLKDEFNILNNDHLFEKAYYSQLMFKRKPNVEIFEQVIQENNLIPAETLFIDDSPQHLEGAKKIGLQTLLMTEKPAQLGAFLKQHGININTDVKTDKD